MTNSVLKTYCAVSGLFFAACAFAQLNDPDPILWIIGYLVGGSFFNVLVVAYHGTAENEEAAGGKRRLLSTAVNAFTVGNFAVISYMIVNLVPRIDFRLPLRDLAWSVLEFEEGREIAGLAILLLHVLRLGGYLRQRSPSPSVATKDGEGGGSSGLVGTFFLASILGGAVYLWVYYQPEMNARYETEHCSGQFASSDGGAQEDL